MKPQRIGAHPSFVAALAAVLLLAPALAAPAEPSRDTLLRELQRYLERNEAEIGRLRSEVEALKKAIHRKDEEMEALRREIEALKKRAEAAKPGKPAPEKPAEPKKPGKPAPEKPRPPARLGLSVVQDPDKGVFVTAVVPGVTGDVAGLAPGDRIVSLNGKPIRTIEDVREALRGVRVGDRLAITYARKGEERTVVVSAGRQPGEAKRLAAPKPPAREGGGAHLGVSVYETERGIEVVGVEKGGPADRAGIRPGDIILAVDGRELSTYPEILAVLGRHKPGDRLAIRVRRGEEERTVENVVLRGKAAPAPEPPKAGTPKPAPPKETPKKRPRGSLGIEAVQAGEKGGVEVVSVLPGGASAGKLEVGDLIVALDGKPIRTRDDLRAALASLHAGDAVRLKIRRRKEEKEVEIRLGAREH